METITYSSKGGRAISFEQLKLSMKNSLSNRVLKFDMEFLTVPNDGVEKKLEVFQHHHLLQWSRTSQKMHN
jgi:hypothetical protein